MSLGKGAKVSAVGRVASNSLLNFSTGVLIGGLSLVFVPLMLRSFGSELYGILSITWMVLANLGWLDFGFSRATARYVAQELAHEHLDKAALWAWTSVCSQTLLGGVGAIVLAFFAPILIDQMHVHATHRELTILILQLFAFSIPVEFVAGSMTGVLQAGQRFGWINSINVFIALTTYLAYGLGILLRLDFLVVVYGVFIVRILNLAMFSIAACKVLPSITHFYKMSALPRAYRSHVITMVKYGSWIAVGAMLGPLLLYFDQWLISVVLGVALLPFYTIPFNALGRLGLLPSSLTSTLFPAFSSMQARAEWGRVGEYFTRAHKYLLVAVIPILGVLYIWAFELFRLWIGSDFASQVALPFRILIFGYGIALLAPLSGALLEAVGRPDVITKLYVVEAPFNIAIVWALTQGYGIRGAALSYSIRAFVETIVLWIVLHKVTPLSGVLLLRVGLVRPCIALIIFVIAAQFIGEAHIDNYFDIATTLTALLVYGIVVLAVVLDERDKGLLVSLCRNRKGAW